MGVMNFPRFLIKKCQWIKAQKWHKCNSSTAPCKQSKTMALCTGNCKNVEDLIRTVRLDHCWTSQLANEIGFFQGFLLKNHLLPAYYLGFD